MNKKSSLIYKLIIMLLILIIIFLLISLFLNKSKTVTKVVKEEIRTEKKFEIDKNQNIVFLGDSIIEIYPLNEIFTELPVVNSGVSGYQTTDILNNINNMVYRYNPTSVIIEIGTNDIAEDTSKEKQKEVVENVKKIVKNINENRPKAKIYIQSLYPVNRNMNRKMVANRTNEAIININTSIKQFCEKSNATYINMHDYLVDGEGNFAEEYTYDGLHPSELGYAKITRILLPYIYDINQ